MSDFHPLKISEIKQETSSAVVVSFEIPSSLTETFSFVAGQYVTIKHSIEGNEVRRAYSICSSPMSGDLNVGIKAVTGGTFSVFANSSLKVGDTLEVMPPQGKFVFEPNNGGKHYAAFVAGSGITPVLSIIKSALTSETESTFIVAYGNQSLEQTMFSEELLQLQSDYPERLHLHFLYSRTPNDTGTFGRIEKSTVNFLLKNKFKDTSFDAFYLCGPEPMIDLVSSVLKENGVNEKMIHFELFTTSEEGLLVEDHDGASKITLIVDDETEVFAMNQESSILDAALEQGLDVPYSCQGGICSTCIARITEGKAEMRKNQILTDGEIAEGLILTCQAHPSTPTIVVDYDDV